MHPPYEVRWHNKFKIDMLEDVNKLKMQNYKNMYSSRMECGRPKYGIQRLVFTLSKLFGVYVKQL